MTSSTYGPLDAHKTAQVKDSLFGTTQVKTFKNCFSRNPLPGPPEAPKTSPKIGISSFSSMVWLSVCGEVEAACSTVLL